MSLKNNRTKMKAVKQEMRENLSTRKKENSKNQNSSSTFISLRNCFNENSFSYLKKYNG